MRGPFLRSPPRGPLGRMGRALRRAPIRRMPAVGRLIVLLCALLPGACGCVQWARPALAGGPFPERGAVSAMGPGRMAAAGLFPAAALGSALGSLPFGAPLAPSPVPAMVFALAPSPIPAMFPGSAPSPVCAAEMRPGRHSASGACQARLGHAAPSAFSVPVAGAISTRGTSPALDASPVPAAGPASAAGPPPAFAACPAAGPMSMLRVHDWHVATVCPVAGLMLMWEPVPPSPAGRIPGRPAASGKGPFPAPSAFPVPAAGLGHAREPSLSPAAGLGPAWESSPSPVAGVAPAWEPSLSPAAGGGHAGAFAASGRGGPFFGGVLPGAGGRARGASPCGWLRFWGTEAAR